MALSTPLKSCRRTGGDCRQLQAVRRRSARQPVDDLSSSGSVTVTGTLPQDTKMISLGITSKSSQDDNKLALAVLAAASCLMLAGCGGGEFDRLSMIAVDRLQSAQPFDPSHHPVQPLNPPHPAQQSLDPSHPIEQPAEVVTSFYRTKLDHYPLDATLTRPVKPGDLVRPEEPDWPARPERPEHPEFDYEAHRVSGQAYLAEYQQLLAAREAAYRQALEDHEILLGELESWYALELAGYEAYAEVYEDVLAQFEEELTLHEAGVCCWDMLEKDSEVASREDVLAMLRENAFSLTFPRDGAHDNIPGETVGRVGEIVGHASPPVVRISGGAAPEARAATLRVIDDINAWLPWEKHLTLGDDIDPALEALVEAVDEAITALNAADEEVAIVIEQASPGDAEWESAWAALAVADENLRAREDALALARGANVIMARFKENMEFPGYGGTFEIAMDKDIDNPDILIRHEMLHALGMIGGRSCYETFGADCENKSSEAPISYHHHVPVSEFSESAMASHSPYHNDHALSSIDGEVLQTIYTRETLWGDRYELENGSKLFEIREDDVSPDNLGPWDDYVIRYSGTFDPAISTSIFHEVPDAYRVEAAFGVDWRNGLARPWADGQVTHNSFAESGLTGTATWTGELLGFTPDRAAVHGDTSIRVDIADLTGSAAFTTLEHWGDYARPGDPGTGIMWGDGDLHYAIEISGNYIRSKGGDTGYVSGRFVGEEHQGAVGILEHPDLAGALGASRR